ncbi:MAG: geranylgeranyl reductase family protein [Candidatus Heimdallarchaeota archaeon]|nr:geranylgeranyl reductase family protein [Candidatus Heimdallarchaeota archaeon]
MVSKEWDLVIIGAGTAGCLAAYSAAKEGLENIALIDRKQKELIGKKICGDGIGTKHLEFLHNIDFPIKENEVALNQIKRAHIISPNAEHESIFPVENQLTIIDRMKFGQILLNRTLEEKVTLFDKTMFKDIKRENGKVKLHLLNSSGDSFVLETSLVIDASGINSKIREGSDFFDEFAQVHDDEQYYCYREICGLENPPEKYLDSAIFEFSFEKTRGGYMWYFNRGNNNWNMGIGIPKLWIDTISPKDVYNKYMITKFTKTKTLDEGGGFVPTRHPIPTHVKDNIILTGDAGAIVNPLHGGGLSPSLASGFIAGKIAAKLVPAEDVKEENLWLYNQQIIERYGLRYAILDLYRILLQNIPDIELNHALTNNYLPLGKIFYAREYDLLMKLSRKLAEVWHEIPNPRFSLLPEYLEKIYSLTNNYPKTPETINGWAKEYQETYSNYQTKITIKGD